MGSKEVSYTLLAQDGIDFAWWWRSLRRAARRYINILHSARMEIDWHPSIPGNSTSNIFLPVPPPQASCNGSMKPAFFTRKPYAFLTIALALFLAQCVERPDPDVEARYQASADRFCNAIVECLKEDISEKMADQPRKLDLFLQRMDQDLCRSGQYQKIQGLQQRMEEGTLLERYERCSVALESTEDCKTRIELLKENSDCRSIRTDQEFP